MREQQMSEPRNRGITGEAQRTRTNVKSFVFRKLTYCTKDAQI